MDSSEKFFEREVDRTPYSAFTWLGVIALALLSGGAFGLLRLDHYIQDHNWLASHSVDGATDKLLEGASAVLSPADQAAKDAADAAQAAATQALLEQKDAAIKSATDSATQAIQSAAPSAAASAAASGQEEFQKYLGQ